MKNRLVVVLLGLAIVAAWRISSREEAAISAGTYLVYDNGGTSMRLTFSSADGDRFGTELEYQDDYGSFGSAGSASTQGDVVDTRMKTVDGRIFEIGSLGPLWVPPGEVHEGGRAHGTSVSEVRQWERWEVGVVTASVGFGGGRFVESGTTTRRRASWSEVPRAQRCHLQARSRSSR